MKQGETFIPDEFQMNDDLRSWCNETFPQIDPEATFTRFREWAEDKAVVSRSWSAKFKRVVRCGVEEGWKGIVVYTKGKAVDPAWQTALSEGRKYGFREPLEHETPSSYRTQLMLWRNQPKTTHSNVLSLKDALKSMSGKAG